MDKTKEEIIKDLDIQDGDKFLFFKIRKGPATDNIKRCINNLNYFELIGIVEKLKKDFLKEIENLDKKN